MASRLWDRTSWALFVMAMLSCIYIIAIAAFRMVGPLVENRLLNPVISVTEMGAGECRGDDQVFSFLLNKRTYVSGGGAELLAFNLRDLDGSALSWDRFFAGDQSSVSAPAGVQIRTIIVRNACGKPFKMFTRHLSPITGLVLFNTWGPFNEGRG